MSAAAANESPGAFDRELTIGELLRGISLDALGRSLTALLGNSARLTDANGRTICGSATAGDRQRGLTVELEPVAYLECAAEQADRLEAAARLMELVLDAQRRCLMVSDLHTEAVRSDYLELQRRHAALEESEARYRALAAELEARVKAQVKLIDDRQRQLYEAEKLASIGQLAAGVAHEINNPIGFVRSNLSTSQGYVERIDGFIRRLRAGADLEAACRAADLDFLLQDFADLLRESLDGVDRVARIVKDLKGFSGVDRAEEQVVNLNDNLETVCRVIAGQLPASVKLTQRFGELPPLLCLPGHLNQVFLNLLTNAMQAVDERGEVSVSSSHVDGEIRVRITDSGAGIDSEVLTYIFDPFFTTRDVGHGTGLGLTVARDIVQAHGGRIEVASAPGAGAEFTVVLPV